MKTMKIRSKKHKVSDKEDIYRDRLSELLDEILVHILSFLLIRRAVSTVLLRRFGKLWTLLRTLKFNEWEFKLMSNVMKYHKSPTIDALMFYWDFDMCEDDLLIRWTKLALRKKTRVLTILFRGKDDIELYNVHLPSHVFTSHCLVSLTVEGFIIKFPRRVFMGSLTKLVLFSVTMSDEMFKILISGCPCLRELDVHHPQDLKQLHFTAPSIEKLELCFPIGDDTHLESEVVDRYYSLNCPNLKILHIDNFFIKPLEVIDVSSVREAVITDGYLGEPEADEGHFEILLEKFRNAEVFQLESKAYLQLEHCGNKKPGFVGNRWTLLALRSRIRGSCLLGICRLLRNSLYLNELIIYANVDFFCECNMLLFELSSPCMMGQSLIQLIEFLLKSAVVLDKLVIVCNRKDKLFSVEGHEFILWLLCFPRSSPNGKVVVA